MANRLVELTRLGQSIWYDQMERSLLSGPLQQMILDDDLRGMTSNPTIFDKAIGGTGDYDDALHDLAREGAGRDAIYHALVLDDIGRAADLFLPVWERTRGVDGFVSLEVSPLLAHDTRATIEEAKRLFADLGRPNVMIKVPATPEGIPAIEELIADGLNINITLIFSRAVYAQVMEAYIRGLERRAEAKVPIDGVRSVASFFVSRIDTKADAALRALIEREKDSARRAGLESLLGKVAIANAKLAYALFKETFSGIRWEALRQRDARVQRPLWASTGTKDPSYSDVLYVDSLIGLDTVNTMPPKTYDAFRDHGTVRATLHEKLDEARAVLERLDKAGISLDRITDELIRDGVKSFSDSFESLMKTIEKRREAAARDVAEEATPLGKAPARADEALANLDRENILDRIWKRDASVWKDDETHRAIIANSLGWLTVPQWTLERLPEILPIADALRGEFRDVVVLGMGGSSLCSEVLRTAFVRREGWPRLHVLDSTVPAAVRALEEAVDLPRTLFIVASKSGTTTEPVMFQKYFWSRVGDAGGDPGRGFVAITDPDTQLHAEAKRDGYRHVFLNPADIGGRYSALSLFGMVPAALAGIDVHALLGRAAEATRECEPGRAASENPAAKLGASLGTLAKGGRDKVTIVASGRLAALGLWIEQLVAESTGKEGKGILPIANEPLEAPEAYGADRVFVHVAIDGETDAATAERLRALRAAGHPVLERRLRDAADLGREMFVWELATAIAGALLEIDPFDQPNVQESKDNTKRILAAFRETGALSQPDRLAADEGLAAFGDRSWAGDGVAGAIARLVGSVKDGDYVALLAYVHETPARNRAFAALRSEIMRACRVATTAGYGPRFLHSTGQLHKGGAGNGVFLQITADDAALPIPGEPFGFETLVAAQAQGDFEALAARGRRALRIHLADGDGGRDAIREIVGRALAGAAHALS